MHSEGPGEDFDPSDIRSVFRANGQVGADLLAVDWQATPLGSLSDWPQSLKTVVQILLSSRFSMWMAWGPELTFFCNDTYRRDTLASKYPWALGRPAREVWDEIWPDIGPRIDEVMHSGTATWDQSLLLFLERSGYTEETYHTFSYSPLTDDDGLIVGMLCVVSEETDRVLGERRMATLNDLGAALNATRTEPEVFAAAERHLGADVATLPFSLVYLFDGHDSSARLAAACGISREHPAAVERIDADSAETPWPAAELALGSPVLLDDLDRRFGALPSGAWDQPPLQALLVPLLAQADTRPYGFLVAGLNRYRWLDAKYEGFVNLVASQLAASIASARAYEAERTRAETLAELDRAKTMFFTNVSHEFRTPLTLLLGPAADALNNELPPSQRTRVEVIQRNGERLLKLVNTLLDFSRLESGRATVTFEPVDLAAYTRDLAGMFAAATERAGLSLDVDCPPLADLIDVDREMWAKIVLNLLSNAFKFTFTGGITVRLRPVDDRVELSVSDTGVGIDESEQPHLFERFHRVDGARGRTFEGSGIGLALVAELVALHNGDVGVRSTPGVGSTFTVTIPSGQPTSETAPVHVPTAAAARNSDFANGMLAEALRWLGEDTVPVNTEPDSGSDSGSDGVDSDARAHVLVVDDNADMRRYISSLLADTYAVELAADGALALEKTAVTLPDLVLTDVNMPNLDGFGLLAALRADPRTAHVPVVMLSARAGEEAAVEGLDAGADDYLSKPFSALELTARVRSNLELERTRREAGRDRVLLAEVRSSRARLDQAQRLARVGSWEIDLATSAVRGSDELLRLLQMEHEELETVGLQGVLAARVHADDRELVDAALAAGRQGRPIGFEVRLVRDDGTEWLGDVHGELVRDEDGRPVRLQGSVQDVTEQRATERALAEAEVAAQVAAQEHRIAEALQRSLVPANTFVSANLDVATFYQAGVHGTQVGGDWYDVIELGAGRTALVIGDVMGRGVAAAAVMGQLRAALRAYARLDLPPADVLEHMDATVRDLGTGQIVTCIYAIYDPGEHSLVYANAGHLPPLLVSSTSGRRRVERIAGRPGPPLGAGPAPLNEQHISLDNAAIVAFYTDGLVERRGSDLDTGIDALAASLSRELPPLADLAGTLVAELCPGGSDDDLAILLAQVPEHAQRWTGVSWELAGEDRSVPAARRLVTTALVEWDVPAATADDVVLMASELVTNAITHGRAPFELRLRRSDTQVVLEMVDGAHVLPRVQRPSPQDEHGRGLQIVALLADSWGTRITSGGKSIWCTAPIRDAP